MASYGRWESRQVLWKSSYCVRFWTKTQIMWSQASTDEEGSLSAVYSGWGWLWAACQMASSLGPRLDCCNRLCSFLNSGRFLPGAAFYGRLGSGAWTNFQRKTLRNVACLRIIHCYLSVLWTVLQKRAFQQVNFSVLVMSTCIYQNPYYCSWRFVKPVLFCI